VPENIEGAFSEAQVNQAVIPDDLNQSSVANLSDPTIAFLCPIEF